MKILYSVVAVAVIAAAGLLAGQDAAGRTAAAIVVPYAAIAVFLLGISYRVLVWARTPVPFRITVTCGEQKSLPWIKHARLENPSTGLGAFGRMLLEVLLFRSLFRNTGTELREGRLVYGENKYLWLGAIAFHYSFLMILLRHLRFFAEPVPALVLALQNIDGFLQIGAPVLYLTDISILAALFYLLWRRVGDARIRYVSLFTDYFALLLLIGIAVTGVLMRYFIHGDLVPVKQLALSLAIFAPALPKNLSPLFWAHLGLVSTLAAYFPFSKLVHMGGVFLSPTRNLANNNRMKRHVNPWNYPVKVHTYEEWEEEFRDKIKAAGLPLERG